MNHKAEPIEFSLTQNAIDSIEQAIQTLAWDDPEDENQRLKNAIRNVAHGVELLLKERLRQIHPSLVWENVDKYPDLGARTVTVDKALSRLRSIGNVIIAEDDATTLQSLRRTRNAIEHFSWSTTRGEAEAIVSRGLSFAIDFAKDHLGIEVFGYEHRRDDTWAQLISRNYSFAKAHATRHEQRASKSGEYYLCCNFCGALAVSYSGGACHICGHWHSSTDTEEIPF